MDIKKVLGAGIKGFVYALLATAIGVLVGALTLALGYKPEGLLNEATWTYVVYPALVGLVALLKNYLQHKSDKPV